MHVYNEYCQVLLFLCMQRIRIQRMFLQLCLPSDNVQGVSIAKAKWRRHRKWKSVKKRQAIITAVLPIRQCATWASTLITHKHSPTEENHANKANLCTKSNSLLNLLLRLELYLLSLLLPSHYVFLLASLKNHTPCCKTLLQYYCNGPPTIQWLGSSSSWGASAVRRCFHQKNASRIVARLHSSVVHATIGRDRAYVSSSHEEELF